VNSTGTGTAEPAIVLLGYGRHYSRRRPWAVRGVSATLPAGSLTALVGPNGAGKSTLIRACVGFEPANEGRVLVAGADPARDRARVVQMVGYVPQANALYRDLTIADHLVIAQAARPTFDRDFAGQHLDKVHLATGTRVGELSGGEQAQVALALALATHAPVLLLDEPLASLDPLARRDFLTVLLGEARRRHATVLLSSHIVTDVEQACDELLVLTAGHLVLHATIAEALSSHCTLPADDLRAAEPIGTFAGPTGQQLALLHGTAGPAASLEEIVLGYLASVRT
jgi:ABC-2 type transport system ATP-binding protein